MADEKSPQSESSAKSRDGATLSPKLREVQLGEENLPIAELPIGKHIAEVARHYKHAAGKSDTYSPEVVDMIYHMSREGDMSDAAIRQFVAAKLAAEVEQPAGSPQATWDQLVFLSANLTRLVIDPYREKCNSEVSLGPDRARPLRLAWPIVTGGVDFAQLPEQVLAAFAAGTAASDLALMISAAQLSSLPTGGVSAIAVVDVDEPPPELARAAAVEISAARADLLTAEKVAAALAAIHEQTGGAIPVGVVAPAECARRVVDETIDLELDFYVADAQWTEVARPSGPLPEATAGPAIRVLADTVDRLRHHCREETRQVVYRGGIRDGADAGKAICCGATAVTIGLAGVVGLGHKLTELKDEATLLEKLAAPLDDADAARRLANVAKSVAIEVTMLARACGKSSVTNMEPEDLRSMSIAASEATGIPLAGRDIQFRRYGENGQA